MSSPTLDVSSVIQRFGGRAELYRKLCLAKIQISHRTLDNWIYHGIIPMQRFLQLIDLANSEGWKLDLTDFIKGNAAPKETKIAALPVVKISAKIDKLRDAQKVITQQIQDIDMELQKYRSVTDGGS